jgi:hypothetical protein
MRQEMAELESCSFQPKTNPSPGLLEDYRPIHERVGDIQRAKKEKMAEARLRQVLPGLVAPYTAFLRGSREGQSSEC